ncbi:MAG: BatD family protein [Dysgonamonadaceae bacterium]|jgi:hypothetical protein|nr:BatD family protein [Dysgonamonadaceae bacterium]
MKKLILFTILCLGIGRVSAQEVTFRASSERTVVVGQQFRIAYTLSTSGQTTAKSLQLGDIKNFDVLYEPTLSQQGSSTSIINGKISSSFTAVYTCVVMAKTEGTFTIPPASATVGNSTYKSNELTVTVLPADQTANAAAQNNSASQSGQQQSANASSDKDIFVIMHVSKNSVYENEGFLVTFKLYSLVDIGGFENVKFPEFEGFISQEIDLGTNTQMNLEPYNGRNYRTAVIKQTVLYPQRSGKITIDAGKFDVVARVRSQQRVRNFFDDFFDTYTNVRRSLSSAPVTINVKPLPATGKPASFSGAVGEYTMTSSINSNNVKSDDAVTVKVNISGSGNIKLIKNPEVVFPNDFEIFDPIVDTKTKATQAGVKGSKTIEYNAIPRYAGNFNIPKIAFSYFDLKTGTYKTLYSEEYKLHVEQGESADGSAAPVVSSTNKEDIRFLGKDIRYIKTGNYNFHKGSFFFGTFNYYLFYIIPALLFIVLFIIYRKQAVENANIALVRTKRANKVASKRLKTAAKYLNENKKEAFYDEMLKTVWGYLSDKLNIPISALTKDNVEANLTHYGVDENLINDFRNILDTAEFARFAPAQGSGAMDELYHSTIKVIDKMENTIKK